MISIQSSKRSNSATVSSITCSLTAFIHYPSCGLPCFKVHKENPCGATPIEPKEGGDPSIAPSAPSSSSTDQITAGTTPQLSSLSISIPKTTESAEEEPGPRIKVAKRTWNHVATSDGALSLAQLELLRSNPELVNTLQSNRLQQQILEILGAEPSAEKKLESVLQTTPEFAEFVQNMLFHLGLRDSTGASTM